MESYWATNHIRGDQREFGGDLGGFDGIPVYRHPLVPRGQAFIAVDPAIDGSCVIFISSLLAPIKRRQKVWRWVKKHLTRHPTPAIMDGERKEITRK